MFCSFGRWFSTSSQFVHHWAKKLKYLIFFIRFNNILIKISAIYFCFSLSNWKIPIILFQRIRMFISLTTILNKTSFHILELVKKKYLLNFFVFHCPHLAWSVTCEQKSTSYRWKNFFLYIFIKIKFWNFQNILANDAFKR